MPWHPAMTLSNIRSLQNKTEGLHNNAMFCYEYQEAGNIMLTETWLLPVIVSFLDELGNLVLWECRKCL